MTENLPILMAEMPRAVLCDLDGTLALLGNRNPYDASRADGDRLNEVVATIIDNWRHCQGGAVLLMTGRQEKDRYVSEQWLAQHGVEWDHLWMRVTGDQRRDAVVKRAMFEANVQGRYRVDFVLDDRQQVVDMWREELGLVCLQVAASPD